MLWKKTVLTMKKCSKWLDTQCMSVFGHADSNGTGYEAVHSDVSSYGIYVCIILETAHHRATFGIFCNITQRLHLKKITAKCSIFFHLLYFFLMGK